MKDIGGGAEEWKFAFDAVAPFQPPPANGNLKFCHFANIAHHAVPMHHTFVYVYLLYKTLKLQLCRL